MAPPNEPAVWGLLIQAGITYKSCLRDARGGTSVEKVQHGPTTDIHISLWTKTEQTYHLSIVICTYIKVCTCTHTYIYIYIYTAYAWVLPGPAMTTGDASSSSSSNNIMFINILIIIIIIISISINIIKPLLTIFNECRSLTGMGELNPYWRSSMNVEV